MIYSTENTLFDSIFRWWAFVGGLCILTPRCLYACKHISVWMWLSECVSLSVCVSVNSVRGAGWAHHRWGSCVGCCHISPIIPPPLPVPESHGCFMSFINGCPRANNSSLQPFITVTSLSEPSRSNLLPCCSPVTLSRLTFVLWEKRRNVCVSKKRKAMKEKKRQKER